MRVAMMFFWICDVPPMTLCARLYRYIFERDVVGVDRRAGAPDTASAACADRLLDPRHQQLVDRAARAVVDAVEPLGQPPAHVQPQHLRLRRAPTRRPRAGRCGTRRDRRAPVCSSSLTVFA